MKIAPELYLKFAKDIEPEIFEDATPRLHLKLINFINGDARFKAAAVFRGAGKSTLLNKIYIISQIYFNAEPYILIASSVEDKAFAFLDSVKKSIDRAYMRGYALSRGSVWNKDRIEVIINERHPNEKRCYVATISAGQDPRGLIRDNIRPTLIIADDLESNSGQFAVSSAANRAKLRRWFYADLLPAIHPKRGKVVVIGTIIHEDSILNNIIHQKPLLADSGEELADKPWEVIKFPILENGKSAWPSRFDLEKIKAIKAQLETMNMAHEFYQEYMCAPLDPAKAIFKREYFRYFGGVDFDLLHEPTLTTITDGVNRREIYTRAALNLRDGAEAIALSDCEIYTTIDLASATGRDKTAILTFAISPARRIYCLDISAGSWTPFEKSLKIIEIFLTYTPHKIGIEKAGMQNDFIYTLDTIARLSGLRLNIETLSHGGRAKNKRIAALEPYYRTGQIYHNSAQSATAELEAQLLSFDEAVEAKSDDIMDAAAYLLQYLNGRFMQAEQDDEYFVSDNGWY